MTKEEILRRSRLGKSRPGRAGQGDLCPVDDGGDDRHDGDLPAAAGHSPALEG